MINIIPVTTKKQRAEFIDFPHDLYMGDPNYVPELFMAQDDLLNPDKHPFYKNSSAQLFLAYKDKKIGSHLCPRYVHMEIRTFYWYLGHKARVTDGGTNVPTRDCKQ